MGVGGDADGFLTDVPSISTESCSVQAVLVSQLGGDPLSALEAVPEPAERVHLRAIVTGPRSERDIGSHDSGQITTTGLLCKAHACRDWSLAPEVQTWYIHERYSRALDSTASPALPRVSPGSIRGLIQRRPRLVAASRTSAYRVIQR